MQLMSRTHKIMASETALKGFVDTPAPEPRAEAANGEALPS